MRRVSPIGWNLVAALVAGLTSCTPAPDAPVPEFRIGLLATLEGPYLHASGLPSVQGAEMAAEEINAAGGIVVDGVAHQVRIVPRSYASRPDDAAIQGRALINQHGIHALVGPQLSAHAIPVAVVAEAAEVPMISPMSSNPATTSGKRWVFRLAFLDDFQGSVLGRFAAGELAARRAAILYDISSQYSRDLAGRFQESFVSEGGTIVAEEHFTADAAGTFVEQLERIARADPEVLFLPNSPMVDSVQMRQARELGIDATFLGCDSWDLQSLPGEDYAEGAYVTHQWHYAQSGDRTTAFVERFKERHGGSLPRTTAAMTYDAVRILAEVAQGTSLAREELRSGIASTDHFAGVTGTISFQGTGDPRRSAVISRIGATGVSVHRVVDP